MFVNIELGQFTLDFHQHGIGGIDYQPIEFNAFPVVLHRDSIVKFMDGYAAILEELYHGGTHLPFHEFSQAIAQFAELFV
jgi:hypothetical protein